MLKVYLFAALAFCVYRFWRSGTPAETVFEVPSAAQGLAALAVVKARLTASGVSAADVAKLDPISDLIAQGKHL